MISITAIILAIIIAWLLAGSKKNTNTIDHQQDSTVNKTPTITKRDSLLAVNIRSLIYKVDFGSTIDDVFAFEGQSIVNFKYDSLPRSTECNPNDVRYYYLKLNNSKLSPHVYNYLERIGLKDDLSNDNSIIYSFMNNRLDYVQIILSSRSSTFYNTLMSSLGQDVVANPTRYHKKVGKYHYVSEYHKRTNTLYILMTNEEGSHFCAVNWWEN